MSSNPPRRSLDPPAEALSARSKLSSTGRMFLMTSAAAYSRNSCCSRAARLRALSNSAWRRARRSSTASRSARSLSTSETAVPAEAVDDVEGVSSPPSAAGSSCSRSRFPSVFPFPLPILLLLRFIQKFVEEPRDIRNRRHGVLIVKPSRPDHRQRSHHLATHARRSADKNKVAHRRHRLIESDDDPYRFLSRVEIRAQQFHYLFFLLQRAQHVLEPLPIILAGDEIGGPLHEHCFRSLAGRERSLLVKLCDRPHQPVVLAAFHFKAASNFGAHVFHHPATEILVDVARREIQFRLRKIEPQHAITHHSRARNHNRQNLLIAQPRKVNVFQRVARPARGDGVTVA